MRLSQRATRPWRAYHYFICPKRHNDSVRCTRRAVRIERVEAGIQDLYTRIGLPAVIVRSLRLSVHREMAASTAAAHEPAQQAKRTQERLNHERDTLMQAYYADAVPGTVFKKEMARLTDEMVATERQVDTSRKQLADVEQILEDALTVAANCSLHYQAAPDFVRRQINQGFFDKIWISEDGSVERYELTEPFAALMTHGSSAMSQGSNGVRSDLLAKAGDLGGNDSTPTSERGRGVNVIDMVELRGFEPLTP
ncbi:hypothetical protein [Pseudonocardia oroxyli]|uniref:hypothetical protein n=1 Tax=Pseudonocardia oroxyli TaxID=366584 RepID=UPI000B86934E|nr:hypothetical protein [Pseudonocardia oroxyli]